MFVSFCASGSPPGKPTVLKSTTCTWKLDMSSYTFPSTICIGTVGVISSVVRPDFVLSGSLMIYGYANHAKVSLDFEKLIGLLGHVGVISSVVRPTFILSGSLIIYGYANHANVNLDLAKLVGLLGYLREYF